MKASKRKSPFEQALDAVNAENRAKAAQTPATIVEGIIGRAFEVQDESVAETAAIEVNVTTSEEVPAPAIVMPTQEELVSLVLSLQAKVTELEARAPAQVQYDEDLTDQLWFLARPNGEAWEDRIVVDKKTVKIEGTQTAFFGPFDNESQITVYLTEKIRKRADSAAEWQTVTPMKGFEARRIRRQEQDDRKKQYGGNTAVNILDRRMRGIFDQLTGNMERVGGVGVAIQARE